MLGELFDLVQEGVAGTVYYCTVYAANNEDLYCCNGAHVNQSKIYASTAERHGYDHESIRTPSRLSSAKHGSAWPSALRCGVCESRRHIAWDAHVGTELIKYSVEGCFVDEEMEEVDNLLLFGR